MCRSTCTQHLSRFQKIWIGNNWKGTEAAKDRASSQLVEKVEEAETKESPATAIEAIAGPVGRNARYLVHRDEYLVRVWNAVVRRSCHVLGPPARPLIE